jgi:HEAT repeat protein
VDPARVEALLAPLAEQEAAGVTRGAATRARQILAQLGTSRARSLLACQVLQRLPRESMLPEMIARVQRDPDALVRDTAARALAGAGDARAVATVASGLSSPSTLTRVHSAEALGTLGALGTIGALEAVPALVNRLAALRQAASGIVAPRAYFFAGTQQAYVSDYNVEVAQASAIAEPVISVLQDGVVLDVRVLGVQRERAIVLETRVIRNALARISGSDLGADPHTWADWYRSRPR